MNMKRIITGKDIHPVPRVPMNIYPAKVVCNVDPLDIGRIRIYIPGVHESEDPNECPWALPCFLGADKDTGIIVVPNVGSWVWVGVTEDMSTYVYFGGFYAEGETPPELTTEKILIKWKKSHIEVTENYIEMRVGNRVRFLMTENFVYINGDVAINGHVWDILGTLTHHTNAGLPRDPGGSFPEIRKPGLSFPNSRGCPKSARKSYESDNLVPMPPLPPPSEEEDMPRPSNPESDCDNSVFESLTDEQLLCLLVYGEARGEPYEGKVAVAYVAINRWKSDKFPGSLKGDTLKETILTPYQFSAFNCNDPNRTLLEEIARNWDVYYERDRYLQESCKAARDALTGAVPDPTGGADSYHAIGINPSWADESRRVAVIGRHIFYRIYT